jgi:transcriptional regulator with XRE-family HTH domain
MMVDLLVGQKLKQRRDELNLSLRELGAQTDLSAAFLSQIECGKSNPSLHSLQRIAKTLGVPLHYFLTYPTDSRIRKEMNLSDSTEISKGKLV